MPVWDPGKIFSIGANRTTGSVRTKHLEQPPNNIGDLPPLNKVRLHLDKITPGMKLAEPITTPAGITLMPAGIRLTPMFLVRIKKWNVEELDVFIEKPASASTHRTAAEQKQSGSESQTAHAQSRREKARDPQRADTKANASSRPRDTKALSAEEEEFARATAAEVSRAFVNVKQNPIMMQLRVAVIKRLIMHGRDGVVNVLRRASRPSGEQESA